MPLTFWNNQVTPHVFERSECVICYETRMRELFAEIADDLKKSQLDWIWESWTSATPPPLRRLATAEPAQLEADFRCQEEPYSYRSKLLLVGGARGTWSHDSTSVYSEILGFAAGRPSAIAVVATDPGDGSFSYLFVPRQPSSEAKELLERWRVQGIPYKTAPYERLHGERIEEIIEAYSAVRAHTPRSRHG